MLSHAAPGRPLRAVSSIAALALLVAACSGTGGATAQPTVGGSPVTQPPASAPAEASASPSADGACEGVKVGFATTQKTGDQSVVDDMVANGLEKARDELGAQTTLVEALDPAAYESVLTNLANAGNNVIATTFNGMTEPLKSVASRFPDVRFVHIYGDPIEPVIPNLRTVAFRFDEATYLSGILSAAATETGILGYEAGLLIPGINADVNAFELGVEKVNPDVEVVVAEVGSFSDDAKARQVSLTLYSEGVDIVQNDGPTVGLIQAAKERNKYAIIAAPGLVSQAPANVMGVTFINFGASLFQQIEAACGDAFDGGHVQTGVKDGTTGFYVPDEFLAEADPAVVERVRAALPQIEEANAELVDGSFVVPFDTSTP